MPPDTTASVFTSLATLLSVTGPAAVIASAGVWIEPVCATPPAAVNVRLVVASAPPIVVRPALEFVTLTVLPLSSKVPKVLPAFVRLMPMLPALEASAVKLATPATESEVPATWLMPVWTKPVFMIVGGLALIEMVPPMSLDASLSRIAVPLTCELPNERLVASLTTVRLPL